MEQVMVYEPELLFSSKIEVIAERLALQVKIMSNLEEFVSRLEETLPQGVLVNLDAAHGKFTVLGEFNRKKTCIGYYSHVNTGLTEEAKRVGIEHVVSRRSFAARLEELMASMISGR